MIAATIGQSCGPARTLDACELGDACTAAGRCQPTLVPADQRKRCRAAFTLGRCDFGDFCDGRSAACPVTASQQCTIDIPEPAPKAKEIEVLCTAPKGKKRPRLKCAAIGKQPVPSSSTRRSSAPAEVDDCGDINFTRQVVAPFRRSSDLQFLESRVKLKLNAFGRRLLDESESGSIQVCVLVKIKGGPSTLKTLRRLVTVTR